jgi:hypothetical protein
VIENLLAQETIATRVALLIKRAFLLGPGQLRVLKNIGLSPQRSWHAAGHTAPA